MGKILVIIGSVVGGLLFAFGLLALAGSVGDTTSSMPLHLPKRVGERIS